MRTIKTVFLGLCIALIALAQTDRGTITGTVQDQASAMVPGAKVSVRNAETGTTSETVTTSTGNFTLAQLPAGTLFLKDLNCQCIDPNKELVLNPKAWRTQPPVNGCFRRLL